MEEYMRKRRRNYEIRKNYMEERKRTKMMQPRER